MEGERKDSGMIGRWRYFLKTDIELDHELVRVLLRGDDCIRAPLWRK